MPDFLNIIDRFPKKREALPEEYSSIYKKHYQENRGGKTPASGIAQKMESWLHVQVAKDIIHSTSPKSTLEIGAGNLNQLKYEHDGYQYDIIEPFEELYKGISLLSRIRRTYSDISQVPQDNRYDRITSIATFEHICNLPEVVARSGLLLSDGASLRASIPSEGTFLWALGWHLTTGLEFKLRYGLDYGRLMAYEHVNTAAEIESVLRHFFCSVKGKVFGLNKAISLYQFFECKNPDLEKCSAYLSTL